MNLNRCFEILEISSNATYEEAKVAYRLMSQVWHPDKYSHNEQLLAKATSKIKEINAAWSQIEEYFKNVAREAESREAERRAHAEQERSKRAEQAEREKTDGEEQHRNVNNSNKSQKTNIHSSTKGHPWRRYWARTLDTFLLMLPVGYLLGLLFPGVVAIIIQRSGGVVEATYPLGIVILPFVMLTEAIILCTAGTTFGKWLLNISVVRKQDESKLLFSEAFMRSLLVWIKGLGFGLPLVGLFTMGFAAVKIKKNVTASWDDSVSANVKCEPLVAWKVCLTVLTFIVLLVINGVFNEMAKSAHTGNAVVANKQPYSATQLPDTQSISSPLNAPMTNEQIKPPVNSEPSSLLYQYEPFIVNIYDGTVLHYLKLGIDVEMASYTVKNDLDLQLNPIRDDILVLLSTKTLQDIQDYAGKNRLKNEIMAIINKHIRLGNVIKIYFTDFVVQ